VPDVAFLVRVLNKKRVLLFRSCSTVLCGHKGGAVCVLDGALL